jgi:hypothetical protein
MVKPVSNLQGDIHGSFIMEWQPLPVNVAIANLGVWQY